MISNRWPFGGKITGLRPTRHGGVVSVPSTEILIGWGRQSILARPSPASLKEVAPPPALTYILPLPAIVGATSRTAPPLPAPDKLAKLAPPLAARSPRS